MERRAKSVMLAGGLLLLAAMVYAQDGPYGPSFTDWITYYEQSADPASAPTGEWRHYFKSTGIYIIDDGGVVYAICLDDGTNCDFPIGSLGDVTITSVADDEILTYDSGSGQWINESLTGSGAICGTGVGELMYSDTGPACGADTNLVWDGTGLAIFDPTPDAPLDVVGDAHISGGISFVDSILMDAAASRIYTAGANSIYLEPEADLYLGGDSNTNTVYVGRTDVSTNDVKLHGDLFSVDLLGCEAIATDGSTGEFSCSTTVCASAGTGVGEILYSDSGPTCGADTNLVWDSVNGWLSIKQPVPAHELDVFGSARISGNLQGMDQIVLDGITSPIILTAVSDDLYVEPTSADLYLGGDSGTVTTHVGRTDSATNDTKLYGDVFLNHLTGCEGIQSDGSTGELSCNTNVCGGTDSYVSYNEAGACGGEADFVYRYAPGGSDGGFLGVNFSLSATASPQAPLHVARGTVHGSAFTPDGDEAIIIEGSDNILTWFQNDASGTMRWKDATDNSTRGWISFDGTTSASSPNWDFHINSDRIFRIMHDATGPTSRFEIGTATDPIPALFRGDVNISGTAGAHSTCAGSICVTGDGYITGIWHTGGTLSLSSPSGGPTTYTASNSATDDRQMFTFDTNDHSWANAGEQYTFELKNDSGLALVNDSADAGNDQACLYYGDVSDDMDGSICYTQGATESMTLSVDGTDTVLIDTTAPTVQSLFPAFNFDVTTSTPNPDGSISTIVIDATASSENTRTRLGALGGGSFVNGLNLDIDDNYDPTLSLMNFAGNSVGVMAYSGASGTNDLTISTLGTDLILDAVTAVIVQDALKHIGTLLGFFSATAVTQQADIGALTDSTGGSTDDTVSPQEADYAEIYVNDNSSSMTATASSWTQITDFDTNGEASGATPDHTNDHITLDTTGKYLVTVSMAVIGATGATFDFSLFKNNGATEFQNVHGTRIFGNATDVGSITASGIISGADSDTLEMWVYNSAVGNKTITVEDITLSVVRIDHPSISNDNFAELTENVNAMRAVLRAYGLMP